MGHLNQVVERLEGRLRTTPAHERQAWGGEHDGHDMTGPLRGTVGSMRPPRESINLGIVTSA